MAGQQPSTDLDPDTWQQIRHEAQRLIRMPGFQYSDGEDVEQRMALRVIQRRRSFDPKRATWKGFVALILSRESSKILRGLYAQKRDYRRLTTLDAAGCNQTHPGCIYSLVEAHYRMADQADLSLDLAECESNLPPTLRSVSQDLRTLTVSEAARKANVPRSTYRDRVYKLRGIYKRAGLEIYPTE